MDLRETADEIAFRLEARTWLEANVPSEPLPSFDTAEGFALHRQWEKKLYDGRWSAVSWPEQYGGRGADYIKWLIFEEEYYRAGGVPAVIESPRKTKRSTSAMSPSPRQHLRQKRLAI